MLTAACAVPIHNHEWCADNGDGANCFHFLTDESRDLSKAEWDDLRVGQVCTMDPPDHYGETFADIKATIAKLCTKTPNACSYEAKKKLSNFFRNLQKVQRGIAARN
jgi:hypothetical protein